MALGAGRSLAGGILVLLVCTVTLSRASVPVLGWSSRPSAFPATGGRFLQDASVDDVLSTHLPHACSTPGPILLFVKDQLSLDDLSAASSSASFQGVRDLMRGAPSSFVVPTTRGDASTGSALASALASACKGSPKTILSADAAVKQPFDASAADETSLFVVNLPADGDADALVSAIVAKAVADTKGAAVTALLTAEASGEHTRERRSVGGPSATSYIPLRSDQRPDVIYTYFTIPIFMGFAVGLIIVIFILIGINGLMQTQTMQIWPDPQVDKNLVVHEN